jgi:glycine cleavage system H protein
MYPEDFYYTKDHEWVKVEGDIATIGITDFAQKQLGDVVFVELPEIGIELEFHQSLGEVESVKAISNIYSAISGKVIEINEHLNKTPALLNDDPHGEGWIARMEIKNKAELEELMSVSEYEQFLDGIET